MIVPTCGFVGTVIKKVCSSSDPQLSRTEIKRLRTPVLYSVVFCGYYIGHAIERNVRRDRLEVKYEITERQREPGTWKKRACEKKEE